MRTVLLFTLLSFAQWAMSQEGDFFLTNYAPLLPNVEHLYFDIEFSDKEELVIANKAGVIKFDGLDWDFYPTPSSVLSIDISESGEIYVGCTGNYGMIGIVEGDYTFKSLTTDTVVNIISQTLIFNDEVYFLQDDRLIVYNPETTATRDYATVSDSSFFEFLFEWDDELYIQSTYSLLKVEDALVPAEPILPEEGNVVICSKNLETNEYVLHFSNGETYTYDGDFKKKTLQDDIYVTDIAWTSPTSFGISTYASGILIFDTELNKVIGNINGGKGLPDNEIFAISSDRDKGLWVANSFGFTRIAPEIPIRSFNYYPGLEGNLLSAEHLEDTWYVATSTGIYYFDQENKYKNTVYYVPKRTTTTTSKPKTPTFTAETSDKKLKPVFNVKNVFAKKKKAVFNVKDPKTSTDSKKKKIFNINLQEGLLSKISKKEKVEYVRRVRRDLVSTQYLYRSMDGLNDKCKQLIPFGDRYIASTPSGIVEIKDNVANEIYDEPVRYLYRLDEANQLVLSTIEGTVKVLELDGDLWLEVYEIETPGDLILSMYRDTDKNLWLAGATNLFQVIIDNDSAFITKSYALENQFFDDIKITEISGQINLVNNQGYFYLDLDREQLVRDENLQQKIGTAKKHLIQSDGLIWVYNGTNWYRIEEDKTVQIFNYLKLFPEMSFIDQVGEDLWLIDNNQFLYKYFPGENDSIKSGTMFYKEVRARSGLVPSTANDLKFDYQNNSIHFEMARPDYLGLLNVEYQHILEGQSEEWSNWTKNNHIDFTYLPAGNYTLRVRSRDTFGREQESEPIKLTITPPYWQTTWFNAMEVLFFTVLVFGSAILNRRTHSVKYSFLTGLLTIVTVVMIIEFLQNVAGSYFGEMGTPVIAFGIDVLVALFVFPIEQLLKKYVQGKPKTVPVSSEV